MDNIAQDVQDYSGRGDSDFTGRGSMFAKSIAAPNAAAANMSTLSPGHSVVPQTSVNGMAAPAQAPAKKKKGEEQKATLEPTTEAFDFDSIFDGEGLTEEFKIKIKTIFEAAVNYRVTQIAEELTKQANASLEEQVASVSEALSSKLDDYLNYVIEEWMTENKLALEEGIRMDIAESFLSGLKELFESHYVTVPEGKTNVLESLHTSNEQLEKELNEKLEENMNLRKALMEQQAGLVFLKVADGLTDVEVEKLASISEGLQWDSVEQYAEKLSILKESYFRPAVGNQAISETAISLQESTDTKITNNSDNTMNVYLSAISRQAKKKV